VVNHMRGWLRRLERTSRRDMLHIPQLDGTTATFAPSAAREAFLNTCERLEAGEDVPPKHPLVEAATNSADPRWALSFFADVEVDGAVEDLSD
jgi:hypothetical protein